MRELSLDEINFISGGSDQGDEGGGGASTLECEGSPHGVTTGEGGWMEVGPY